MRSLILATAGHVDHGKSTFIQQLTGINPRRTPHENEKEMSLDLGFAHRKQISFIDCPGDLTKVGSLVTALNHCDGLVLVVSLKDGIQDQTLLHLRMAQSLGIKQVLVVFTFADFLPTFEERKHRASELFTLLKEKISDDVHMGWWVWGPYMEEKTYEKIKKFFAPTATLEDTSYPRFFIDRAFEIPEKGIVVTGTFTSGAVANGMKCFLFSPHLYRPVPVEILRIQSGSLAFSPWNKLGRVSLLLSGVNFKDVVEGSFLILSQDLFEFSTHAAVKLDLWKDEQSPFTAPVRFQNITVDAKFTKHPTGFWKLRFYKPLPLLRGDRFIVGDLHEKEGLGTPMGAGEVLDAYFPLGKVQSPIPDSKNNQDFISWVKAHDEPKNFIRWSLRLGVSLESARNILESQETVPLAFAKLSEAETTLEKRILDEKWLAFLSPDELDLAYELVRKSRVVHLKENHFLHVDRLQEVLDWLNDIFSKQAELSLVDAKNYFGVSRSTYDDILNFCDKNHLTFKKDNSRKAFRLIKTWRSSDAQTLSARANGRRFVRPELRY